MVSPPIWKNMQEWVFKDDQNTIFALSFDIEPVEPFK
jgi:hypothetical protein